MKINQSISLFFKKYCTFLDRVFITLVVLALALGSGIFFLNKVDFHYSTVVLFATDISSMTWTECICLILLSLVFLFYGMYVKDESPRSSTFIWGLGLFFWCGLANMIMTNSIQSTPFPPIDPWLLKMDRLMGFSSSALMTWTHNHPHCRQIFNIAYAGLLFELLGIPILLTLFNGRKALSIFYIAQLSTMIIGSLIYFFFPTMAPSAVVHSPYFMHAEHDTSLRFYQIHHFLKVTSNDGGLIAFPSFHVLWAVLLTNTCRGEKRIFYPLACFNFILIISTVFLGWHYLSDVISGALLGVVGIYFGEWVYYRSESHTRLKQ